MSCLVAKAIPKLIPYRDASVLNYGLACANAIENKPKQRTIVVCGPPRSGTSMVARLLVELGVPMGRVGGNYEDQEFVDVLHKMNAVDKKELSKIIDSRNAQDVWGFKVPMAISSLLLLEASLREPFFIFIFRDVLAAAIRNYISTREPDINSTLQFYNLMTSLMVNFIGRTNRPCLLISYEKAILNPLLMCNALTNFSGMPERSELALIIEPNNPDYLGLELDGREVMTK